jgi:hypothetical protein
MTRRSFIDNQAVEMGHLILQDSAFSNPLSSSLTPAVAEYTSVRDKVTTGDLSASSISTAISDIAAEPISGAFTAGKKAALLASLDSIDTSMIPYQGTAQLALDGASNLLTHANNMVSSVLGVAGSITGTIDLPNMLESDIGGGLPTSFPGIPDLSGIAQFDGFPSIPAIPSLSLPSLPSISGILSAENLPGVNLPGIPNPSDVMKSLSGSIVLPEFGGVGSILSGNTASIATSALNGMNPLGDVVGDVAGALGDPAKLATLSNDAVSAVTDFIPGMDELAAPFGDYGAGELDLISAETDGLGGAACSSPGLAVGAGCGSAAAAYSQATAVQAVTKSAVGSSLIQSVATPEMQAVLDQGNLPSFT